MLVNDEKFVEQIKKDLKIDKQNIEVECLDYPLLKQRYTFLMIKKMKSLKEIEEELAKKYKQRYDFYKNNYNVVLEAKEVKTYIDADDEYLEVKKKYDIVKLDIDFLEKTLNNLDSKYWNMKLFIDYQQFIKGER